METDSSVSSESSTATRVPARQGIYLHLPKSQPAQAHLPPCAPVLPSGSQRSNHSSRNRRPLTAHEEQMLVHVNRLKEFIATALDWWDSKGVPYVTLVAPDANPAINRFHLPYGDHVSCILWFGRYYITTRDIMRIIRFRLSAFGRPVTKQKQFEEGILLDLEKLMDEIEHRVEGSKSTFGRFLVRNDCVRETKAQTLNVYQWQSVPHDLLFLNALERDLRLEAVGHAPTSIVTGEPAQSFEYDPKRPLWAQFLPQDDVVPADKM